MFYCIESAKIDCVQMTRDISFHSETVTTCFDDFSRFEIPNAPPNFNTGAKILRLIYSFKKVICISLSLYLEMINIDKL